MGRKSRAARKRQRHKAAKAASRAQAAGDAYPDADAGASGQQATGGPQAVPEVLLTVAQVCELLKVSRSTVDRLARRGELPGKLRVGGQVRYLLASVLTWLQGQAANRTGPNRSGHGPNGGGQGGRLGPWGPGTIRAGADETESSPSSIGQA